MTEPSFGGHVGKGSVAVILVEDRLAIIADEQIVQTVVVVVADTASLAPTRTRHSRSGGDVGECTVAVVLEKPADWFLTFWETFEPRAAQDEDVHPAVIIIIVKGYAAAVCFDNVFFAFDPAVDDRLGEAGLEQNTLACW